MSSEVKREVNRNLLGQSPHPSKGLKILQRAGNQRGAVLRGADREWNDESVDEVEEVEGCQGDKSIAGELEGGRRGQQTELAETLALDPVGGREEPLGDEGGVIGAEKRGR